MSEFLQLLNYQLKQNVRKGVLAMYKPKKTTKKETQKMQKAQQTKQGRTRPLFLTQAYKNCTTATNATNEQCLSGSAHIPLEHEGTFTSMCKGSWSY